MQLLLHEPASVLILMSGSGCCSTKLGPTMIYMSKRFAEKDMRTERNNVEVVVGGLMML